MAKALHLFVMGLLLAVVLLAAGTFVDSSPTPKCPGCAVLAAPYSCPTPEQVVGGWICS
jgi:hypothetical protein